MTKSLRAFAALVCVGKGGMYIRCKEYYSQGQTKSTVAMADFSKAKLFLEKAILENKSLLSEDTISAVRHYLDHGEYEMAFEGLFIDMMQCAKKVHVDYDDALKIGKSLQLDDSSVFDSNFWEKLLRFFSQTK